MAVLSLSAASAVCRDAGMGGGASGRTEGEAKPVSDFASLLLIMGKEILLRMPMPCFTTGGGVPPG